MNTVVLHSAHNRQKCLVSAQPPEDWCWSICGQHEINAPVLQICVNVARCRLHTTSCMTAPNSNFRATSMRWTTLLSWNTLLNQRSDQHVFLFMYTKEVVSQCFFTWRKGKSMKNSKSKCVCPLWWLPCACKRRFCSYRWCKMSRRQHAIMNLSINNILILFHDWGVWLRTFVPESLFRRPSGADLRRVIWWLEVLLVKLKMLFESTSPKLVARRELMDPSSCHVESSEDAGLSVVGRNRWDRFVNKKRLQTLVKRLYPARKMSQPLLTEIPETLPLGGAKGQWNIRRCLWQSDSWTICLFHLLTLCPCAAKTFIELTTSGLVSRRCSKSELQCSVWELCSNGEMHGKALKSSVW